VASSQIATSVAGAAIVPAVAGITLGIVRQRSFNRQNGRNQAFNPLATWSVRRWLDICAGVVLRCRVFACRPVRRNLAS
jgi:hypothetical protein